MWKAGKHPKYSWIYALDQNRKNEYYWDDNSARWSESDTEQQEGKISNKNLTACNHTKQGTNS